MIKCEKTTAENIIQIQQKFHDICCLQFPS